MIFAHAHHFVTSLLCINICALRDLFLVSVCVLVLFVMSLPKENSQAQSGAGRWRYRLHLGISH